MALPPFASLFPGTRRMVCAAVAHDDRSGLDAEQRQALLACLKDRKWSCDLEGMPNTARIIEAWYQAHFGLREGRDDAK